LYDPKFIYVIRDPVDRILSEYTQKTELWPNSRPFSVANIENHRSYLQTSSYFLQLSQYLKLFPRESIQVVILERLSSDPRKTLRQIFHFLGVDESFWSADFERRLNIGEKKR